jgi:uncharacterized protein YjbI with pentapeptide repeats
MCHGFAGGNINLRRANLSYAEMGMDKSFWSCLNELYDSFPPSAKGGAQNYLDGPTNDGITKVDLREAVLDGADMRGVNLHRAQLQGASMKCIDLQGAQLSEANLQGVQLQTPGVGDGWNWKADEYYPQSNLRDAGFYLANLQGADMTGAILDDAELRQASLKGETCHSSRAPLPHQ